MVCQAKNYKKTAFLKELFLDMLKTLFKNVPDMAVGKGVKDNFPLFIGFHEIGKPEGFKLVGYGGFGHVEESGKVADAHFITTQGPEDFKPGFISKHLVEVRQIVKSAALGHEFLDFIYYILVDYVTIAG
jgi:hypothetical protein